MATLEELQEEVAGLRADVGELGPALANIAADIDKLSLPPVGGLTDEQAETLRVELAELRTGVRAVVDSANEIAARTPDV